MIYSTQGILLHTVKHSDSSAIIHVFTKKFGRKPYFIRGLSKKKNSPRALLFPLALLEMQVTDRDSKDLQQIREIALHLHTPSVISDPLKSSLVLFLTEVLHKSIEENYVNEVLFDFLESAVQMLDVTPQVKNFHLWFLLELAKYLGFYPSKNYARIDDNIGFNLETGLFTREEDYAQKLLDQNVVHIFHELLGMNFDKFMRIKLSSTHRRTLLRGLVDYYITHVPGVNKVSSLEVLETVFD